MLPELETICTTLEALHAEIARHVQEIDAEGLNWKPGPGFNSIYAIATHVAGSQRWWVVERIAGKDVGRDRLAEFRAAGDDPAVPVRALSEAMRQTRRVFEELTAESMSGQRPGIRDRPTTVRWIALHLVEHAALHLGHIQITRQWWEEAQRGRVE